MSDAQKLKAGRFGSSTSRKRKLLHPRSNLEIVKQTNAHNMKSNALNRSFRAAKASKQDEFYTQLSDIEKELKHYAPHFKGKAVYCNCDDPRISNFFHYFSYNFKKLSLKKLVATCYKNQDLDLFSRNDAEQAIYLEYSGSNNQSTVPEPEGGR
jgi:hypothetical protein